jgi:hypothetical protein
MLKLCLGIDGGVNRGAGLFFMTPVAEHGGSFIETVGILSRKESQLYLFSFCLVSLVTRTK